MAGDILPRFRISTKIGFFPRPGGAEHSLDPSRLRLALEQTAKDLRRAPDTVLLHNPERTLSRLSEARARDCLAQACAVLSEGVRRGLCESWGFSSWNPRPLPDLIDSGVPTPSVLMIRAGLLVGIDSLDAADTLADRWNLPTLRRWGMSPFGGSTRDPIWKAVNPRVFLQESGRNYSSVQAAFRASYYLPYVGAVVVGSDDTTHLRELITSLDGVVNEAAVEHYRKMLRERVRQRDSRSSARSLLVSRRAGSSKGSSS